MMEPARDLGLLLQGLIVNRPADQEPHSQDTTTGVIDRSFVCANTVPGIDTIGPYAAEPPGPPLTRVLGYTVHTNSRSRSPLPSVCGPPPSIANTLQGSTMTCAESAFAAKSSEVHTWHGHSDPNLTYGYICQCKLQCGEGEHGVNKKCKSE